jgi:hypothetical protein
VLVDAAHPWRSQVPGGNVETGDHWITDRQGAHGSCAFTHATIKKLLALATRTYQGRDVGHLESGLCDWNLGSRRGESIRPCFNASRVMSQGTCDITPTSRPSRRSWIPTPSSSTPALRSARVSRLQRQL